MSNSSCTACIPLLNTRLAYENVAQCLSPSTTGGYTELSYLWFWLLKNPVRIVLFILHLNVSCLNRIPITDSAVYCETCPGRSHYDRYVLWMDVNLEVPVCPNLQLATYEAIELITTLIELANLFKLTKPFVNVLDILNLLNFFLNKSICCIR